MVKSVLVNGCSFSRGPHSWPYLLQEQMSFDLVNLAQSGAGNDYIFHSTMSEIYTRSYDLVLIMWSGIERADVCVEDIDMFDTPYTSKYQSQQNDWPGKIIHPVNDQDFVPQNWVFGCGHINGDRQLRSSALFSAYYRFVGTDQMTDAFITKLVSLQNTLLQLKIPYAFSFYEDYAQRIKQRPLSHAMDWQNICVTDNIDQIAKRNQWFADDGTHPGPLAHAEWAKILKEHLCTNTLK